MSTDEGEFDAVRNEAGRWRWVYISPAAAEYLGPQWYRTKREALQAGREWLAARGNR